MKNEVIQRIIKLRRDKGLSQENVADELGVTTGTYSKIETGRTDPNLTRLLQIATILKVDITEFFPDTLKFEVSEPKKGYETSKETLESLQAQLEKLLSHIDSLRTEMAEIKKSGKGKK